MAPAPTPDPVDAAVARLSKTLSDLAGLYVKSTDRVRAHGAVLAGLDVNDPVSTLTTLEAHHAYAARMVSEHSRQLALTDEALELIVLLGSLSPGDPR